MRRLKEENKSETVKILKTWAHSSQENEFSTNLVQKLNPLTDSDIILALKAI